MTVELAPDRQGENIVVANPDMSVLVVRSEIAGLSFVSTRGILEVDQPANGIYHVKVEPGVNVFTFNAPGFQAITSYRLAMPKKAAITVDITVLEPGAGARGTLAIETSPPGATITLNGVTLADKTPVILPNQPTGSNIVRIEVNESDYSPVDTTFIIDADQTTRLDVALPRLRTSLRVTSDPPGALVVLDGVELGTTPLTRSDLTPGEKTLLLSLKDYETNTQPVRLRAGEIATVNAYLVRTTGRIEVTTDPSRAEISLDGVAIGIYSGSPLVIDKLEPGRYKIGVTLEGYEETTRSVTVEGLRTSTVSFTLEALNGAIYVASTPIGASIWLDGRDTGVTTPGRISEVPPGTHLIELRKAGFQETSCTVAVFPGGTESLTEQLDERRFAALHVTTTPTGATVFVDGKRVGRSPMTVEQIEIGSHQVQVKKNDYVSQSKSFNARSGKRSDVHINMPQYTYFKHWVLCNVGACIRDQSLNDVYDSVIEASGEEIPRISGAALMAGMMYQGQITDRIGWVIGGKYHFTSEDSLDIEDSDGNLLERYEFHGEDYVFRSGISYILVHGTAIDSTHNTPHRFPIITAQMGVVYKNTEWYWSDTEREYSKFNLKGLGANVQVDWWIGVRDNYTIKISAGYDYIPITTDIGGTQTSVNIGGVYFSAGMGWGFF